jgi:hypothetical protein
VVTSQRAGVGRVRQHTPSKLEAKSSKLEAKKKDRRANADLSPVSSVVKI